MYDVILVFGHTVTDEGVLSKEQVLRIMKSINILNKNKARFLLMSGGFGDHFNKTDKSLAWHMKKFAMGEGVPPDKILTEDKSYETMDNITFSKPIIDEHKWKSIIFVSSKYHIPRIKLISKYIFPREYKLKFVSVRIPKNIFDSEFSHEKEYYKEYEQTLKEKYKTLVR